MTRILIVGGGFAGVNAAKVFGRAGSVGVTLIDKRNHHLFQPLLYQVATAGLSPADIAAPIRSMLSEYSNVTVLLGEVRQIDLVRGMVVTDTGDLSYDYLILCCGATHSYFGHDEWEEHKAIIEIGSFKLGGWPAWVTWLTVHIYYLTGFRNRLLVVLQWAWSYLTFGRGARLIIGKNWRET